MVIERPTTQTSSFLFLKRSCQKTIYFVYLAPLLGLTLKAAVEFGRSITAGVRSDKGAILFAPKRGKMAAVESKENATFLAERDGGWFCHYCKVPVGFTEDIGRRVVMDGQIIYTYSNDTPVKPFSIDHKKPKCNGGPDDLSNLLLTCRKCNQRKGKKDYDQFIAWLLKVRPI